MHRAWIMKEYDIQEWHINYCLNRVYWNFCKYFLMRRNVRKSIALAQSSYMVITRAPPGDFMIYGMITREFLGGTLGSMCVYNMFSFSFYLYRPRRNNSVMLGCFLKLLNIWAKSTKSYCNIQLRHLWQKPLIFQQGYYKKVPSVFQVFIGLIWSPSLLKYTADILGLCGIHNVVVVNYYI